MKPIFFGLLMSAVLLFAQSQEDEKKEIKIYKRLIPADVLRGECRLLSRIFWFEISSYVSCLNLNYENFHFYNFTTLTNATRRSDSIDVSIMYSLHVKNLLIKFLFLCVCVLQVIWSQIRNLNDVLILLLGNEWNTDSNSEKMMCGGER